MSILGSFGGMQEGDPHTPWQPHKLPCLCLPALLSHSCLDPRTWYTVYVSTSDVRGAGTDADVHIALWGSQGSSGSIQLPSQPQQYQRGQRDRFRCAAPYR